MGIFSNNIISGGGGGAGGAPPITPYPVEYDAIVNSDAVTGGQYIGETNVFDSLASAIAYIGTEGLSEGKIRIDEDRTEGTITIPATVNRLRLYSETGNSITTNFQFADTNSNIQRLLFFKGLNVTQTSGTEFTNATDIHYGTFELEFDGGTLNTTFPVIPDFTLVPGADVSVTFKSYNNFVWNHDSAAEGGEPAIKLNVTTHQYKIEMFGGDVRIVSALQAPFIEMDSGSDFGRAFGRFFGVNFYPEYYAPEDPAPTSASAEFMILNTNSTNNGGEPTFVFSQSRFSKSPHIPFSLGQNTIIEVNTSLIDTTAANWAIVFGSAGGTIYSNNSIVNHAAQTDVENGIQVVYNPGFNSPPMYTAIISSDAPRFPGDLNTFETVQEALDWAAGQGLTYVTLGMPGNHSEVVNVPSSITDVNLWPYPGKENSGVQDIPAVRVSFQFDMTINDRVALGVYAVSLSMPKGSTAPTIFGDTTSAAQYKTFQLTTKLGGQVHVGATQRLVDFNGAGGDNRFELEVLNGQLTFLGEAINSTSASDRFFISVSDAIWRTTGHFEHDHLVFSGGLDSSKILFKDVLFLLEEAYPTVDNGNTFLTTEAVTSAWESAATNKHVQFHNCVFMPFSGYLFSLGPNSGILLSQCSIGAMSGATSTHWAKVGSSAGGDIWLENCVFTKQSRHNYESGLNVHFNPDWSALSIAGLGYDVIVNGIDDAPNRMFVDIQAAIDWAAAQSPTYDWQGLRLRMDIETDGPVNIPTNLHKLSFYSLTHEQMDPHFTWADTTTSGAKTIEFYNLYIENTDEFMNFSDLQDPRIRIKFVDCEWNGDFSVIDEFNASHGANSRFVFQARRTVFQSQAEHGFINCPHDDVSCSIDFYDCRLRHNWNGSSFIAIGANGENSETTIRINDCIIEPSFDEINSSNPFIYLNTDSSSVSNSKTLVLQDCSFGESYRPLFSISPNTVIDVIESTVLYNHGVSVNWAETNNGNGGTIACVATFFDGISRHSYDSGLTVTFNPDLTALVTNTLEYDVIVNGIDDAPNRQFITLNAALNYCQTALALNKVKVRIDISLSETATIPTEINEVVLVGAVPQLDVGTLNFVWADTTSLISRKLILRDLYVYTDDYFVNYLDLRNGSIFIKMYNSYLYNDGGYPIFGPPTTQNNDISMFFEMDNSHMYHVEGGDPIFDVPVSVNGTDLVGFMLRMRNNSIIERGGRVDSPIVSANVGTTNQRVEILLDDSKVIGGSEGAGATSVALFDLDTTWAFGRHVIMNNVNFATIDSPIFNLNSSTTLVRATDCFFGCSAGSKWATGTDGTIEANGCMWGHTPTYSNEYDAALTVTLGSDTPVPS